MSRADLIAKELADKQNELREYSRATQNMKRRHEALSSQAVVANSGTLAENLAQILPPELLPANVGHINKVAWEFYYEFTFDLGANPVIDGTLRQRQSIQVSQEAAFIATGIVRHADDYTEAGDLGPFQVEIQDRQSTRFINDEPIPIQMIGQKGYYSAFPTGMLFLPNAFIDMFFSSWLAVGANQQTFGDGQHKFVLHGYRTRVEDVQNVLSTVFSQTR